MQLPDVASSTEAMRGQNRVDDVTPREGINVPGVARQAHNLKVVGSNPTPATKKQK